MSPSGDRAGDPRQEQGQRRAASPCDSFAGNQDQHTEWTRSVALPVTNWLVDAVAARPGETVLELAAGAGDVGFAIIERLCADARLISSDLSPATVNAARAAAEERGLTGIEFRVLDAQNLDLPSGSVDAVVCRWGYMLMQDAAAALRETARVLNPRGRVAFSVWGDPARNPWTTIDAQICADVRYAPPTAPTDPGGIFSLADEERLAAMVQASGLRAATIERIPLVLPYADVDDYVAHEIEQPGARGEFFGSLSDRDRALAIEEATRLLEPYRAESGYLVPGETINILAVRDPSPTPSARAPRRHPPPTG